jgi:hypothetical protein
MDKKESPYAVIKFRYRTEREYRISYTSTCIETECSFTGALKGLGLIPRTPLPSLSPELEAVKVKIEETDEKKKRERSTSAEPSTLPPKSRKKKRTVIDLTGDSD